MTIIRLIILKLSGLHTSVRNSARYPLQLGGHPVKLTNHPVKLTRNPANIGRNYSHIIQNLERSYLCGDGGLIQESLSMFDEGGAEVPNFFVDLAAEIDQRALPCKFTSANEVVEDDVQNRGSFA